MLRCFAGGNGVHRGDHRVGNFAVADADGVGQVAEDGCGFDFLFAGNGTRGVCNAVFDKYFVAFENKSFFVIHGAECQAEVGGRDGGAQKCFQFFFGSGGGVEVGNKNRIDLALLLQVLLNSFERDEDGADGALLRAQRELAQLLCGENCANV